MPINQFEFKKKNWGVIIKWLQFTEWLNIQNHIVVVFIIIIMKKDFLVIETYMGIPESVVSWSEMFIQNKHGENARAQDFGFEEQPVGTERVLPVTVTHAEPLLWLGSRL